MTGKKMDLLRGTLDLLVLQVLQLQPLHGVGVADRIKQITKGTFDVPAGSLFPALHRLEHEGWIEGEWSVEGGKRIKCYALTASGRKQLVAEQRSWNRAVQAVSEVIEATSE
jgi:transcriptional regulator